MAGPVPPRLHQATPQGTARAGGGGGGGDGVHKLYPQDLVGKTTPQGWAVGV